MELVIEEENFSYATYNLAQKIVPHKAIPNNTNIQPIKPFNSIFQTPMFQPNPNNFWSIFQNPQSFRFQRPFNDRFIPYRKPF